MKSYLKYWVAFSSVEEIDSRFVHILHEKTGSIKAAWNIDIETLEFTEGVTKKQKRHFLDKRKQTIPDECLEFIQSRGYEVLTFDSPKYPELLKNIYNPPMTLFVLGDLDGCNLNKTLAMVGSRKASQYAKDALGLLIDGLVGMDICIVSGLAAGIDTVAHESAIKNGIKTIGVVGSGFDFTYPNSNKKLYKQIEKGEGAILTEYYPHFAPLPYRFPQRNRIVSGLCQGTLVAEAALRSGALVTANLTLEQGRELMCIPGNITNPNTAGIYKLLKSGATMVTCAQDIYEAMNWALCKSENATTKQHLVGLDEQEAEIVEMLMIESLSIDNILSGCNNLKVSDLMVVLTKLELRGLIKQIDGDRYTSCIKF